jgi:transcription termination factor Rho
MSVLRRKELEDSPLADLHAIASEFGLEGFRARRKADLIDAIIDAQGGEEEGDATEAGLADTDDGEPDVTEAGLAGDEPPEEPPDEPEPPADEPEPPADEPEPAAEEEPEVVEEPKSEEEIVAGVLDILPNGSGFVRHDPAGQSPDDVYVAPAQIRRCELRAGDQVSGPVRPPRRNERHPSLVRVETVNGADAEPPEQRPEFAELTPVFPRERLEGPAAVGAVPFGKGSRVAISGTPGAGATSLLREIASALAERHPDVELQVVLAGVRPEEVTEWRAEERWPVFGGSFERSAESQAQAAELVAERAKRHAERGGHAAILVDSLDALPAAAQRRVFGSARATEEAGSVTVIAATGEPGDSWRWATTRIALEPRVGGSGGGPAVSAERSGTVRAEALGA